MENTPKNFERNIWTIIGILLVIIVILDYVTN